MIKIKLTEEQIEEFAAKIFDENFPDHEYGNFKDQNYFVRHGWIKEAYESIQGYNAVARHIDFPGISITEIEEE